MGSGVLRLTAQFEASRDESEALADRLRMADSVAERVRVGMQYDLALERTHELWVQLEIAKRREWGGATG